MSEKLNHIPTEIEAATAIKEAQDASIDAGLYNRDKHHNEDHQLIGPAGATNLYIRRGINSGKLRIEGRTVHEGRAGLRHIESETRTDRYGEVESQSVNLSKREANGKWRELTTDNPLVVRMAEIAIANTVKHEAEKNTQETHRIAA